METKVYFENIEKILLEELSKAQSSIKLVVAWLTNKKLFAKLVELAEKGITVNVIINDDEINKDSFLDYSRLNIGKSFLKMSEAKNGNILHHKFCIIDDITIINGSYNWTFKANYNHENINIVENDNELIVKYKNEFKKILIHSIQETKQTKNINVTNQPNVFTKKDEKDFYAYLEENEQQFIKWADSQNLYDIEFISYLNKLNENIYYNFGNNVLDARYLEEHIGESIIFYYKEFNNKHPAFLKYLLHITINVFKENLKNYDFEICESTNHYHSFRLAPFYHSKVKDLIYQDRFDKSVNAYQYKLSLLLIMLDFAYDDFEYNGFLNEPSYYDSYSDYTKEPKIYSSEVIKKIEFIRDIKLEELNYTISENKVIKIKNCIRYFSSGKPKTYSENEESDFLIESLNNDLNRNIYDSELEFEDVILKMKVNNFDAIANEIKENGLVNSFVLAKLITEINMNINLDFITNKSELKTIIKNLVEQNVIIKDIVHNENDDIYKIVALQWSFDKTKADIKEEILMINYLWLFHDFESKHDIWEKLKVEKVQAKSYENYVNTYKGMRYLNSKNIKTDDFRKEDKKYQNIIKEKAAKEIKIPEDIPFGFNILELFNSLKVNVAEMVISKDILESKGIKKGDVLDDKFKVEFKDMSSNIQINESVKPFIWLENGENIRVNKNAKKCKNTGNYLLKEGDYIYRQTSLVLGESNNQLLEDNSATEIPPDYAKIEERLQEELNVENKSSI